MKKPPKSKAARKSTAATLTKTPRRPRPRPPKGKSAAPATAASRRNKQTFPIAGIGASAGGLEAFTQLLKHLPADTGLGFVLVQHLDPQHESALTQLLSRATSMPVCEVTNRLRVEANHVYIIPPNTSLSIVRGVLKLHARGQIRAAARSIDAFFESLAQDQRECAIGVILSGTATDGTLGLEAIKAEGGITFAQDDSAKYDSMPRSAAAAGCVDFVLSPENIAKELARIAKHPYVANASGLFCPEFHSEAEREANQSEGPDAPLAPGGHGTPRTGARQARAEAGARRDQPPSAADNGFKNILLLLRNHCGVDFSLYKSTTIQRRISRRMVLNKHMTAEEYARFLRGNSKELDALYSDCLISVTSFFRNPETFELLRRKVFPQLLHQQRGEEPVRVWVLGCSTGQEAYSIAMAFQEAQAKFPRAHRLQVFATDLNDALLNKARHGLYAKSLAEDVSPERLRRFFVEEDGGYRIIKSLREMVVFARQNLIADPPFSRMDLISCRNLLIYLEPSLQKKALPTFHYALKPEGFLFLGASESISGFTDLFEVVDRKHKIYSRKAAPTPGFHLPARSSSARSADGPRPQHTKGGRHAEISKRRPPSDALRPETGRAPGSEKNALTSFPTTAPEGFRSELSAEREADRMMVNQFAPPGVLINAEGQILQFRGPTSAYLEPPTGKASFDVLKMAREGLMLPLRAALHQARKENKTVRKENVRVRQNGHTRTVNVEVIPLKNLRERCFVILFEEARGAHAPRVSVEAPRLDESGRRLRTEPAGEAPAGTREARVLPGQSRRVAELEADLAETRDYLQSVQEQHEAANEELQASNEEVQSANEELQSINEEMETAKEELESSNEELTTVNEEMASRNTELNRLNSDLGNLQTSSQLAIVLLGRDLAIRRFSAQAEKQFGLLAADLGRPFGHVRHNLVFGGAHAPRVSVEAPRLDESGRRARRKRAGEAPAGTREARALPEPEHPPDLETLLREVIDTVREQEHEVQDREGHWFSLRVRPYLTLDNKVDGAVLVLVDIDALKRGERELQIARNYAEAMLRTARDPLLVLRADLRVNTANEAFHKTFQTLPDQVEGRLIYDLGNRQWDIPKLRDFLEDILPRNSFFNDFEVTQDFPSLGRRTMLLNARRLDQGASSPHPSPPPGAEERVPAGRERRLPGSSEGMILLAIEDVTERLEDRAALRHSELRYRRLFETSHDGVLILDPVSRKITDANPFMVNLLGYPRAALLGRELWEIGLLRDEQASHDAFRELQERGLIRYEDLPLETASGQKREVEFVSNVYEENGRSVVQCNVRDITQRKRAEETVRQSAALFSTVVEQAPNGLYVVDAQFRVQQVNARALPVFGQVQPLLGRDFSEVIQILWGPETGREIVDIFRHTLETGERYVSPEFTQRRHDLGMVQSYEWETQRLTLPNGEHCVVCYFSDITERQRTEQALASARNELTDRAGQLEEVVAWRTTELREANEHLEAFVYSVAHDLRRPTRAMQGYAQVLLEEYGPRLDEPGRDYAARIERSARFMDHLLLDLLDFSRLSKVAMPLQNVSLKDVMAEVLEQCAAEIQQRQARVEVIAPLPSMRAHAAALAQVLTNLLTNAIKFVAPGVPPVVRIRAEEIALVAAERESADDSPSDATPRAPALPRDATTRVRLWVEDNGIGIAPEYQERIFHVFERLHGSAYPGTGIGLTIVRKGAERMGGRAGVESVPGEGSRFWIELGKAREEEAGARS